MAPGVRVGRGGGAGGRAGEESSMSLFLQERGRQQEDVVAGAK